MTRFINIIFSFSSLYDVVFLLFDIMTCYTNNLRIVLFTFFLSLKIGVIIDVFRNLEKNQLQKLPMKIFRTNTKLEDL